MWVPDYRIGIDIEFPMGLVPDTPISVIARSESSSDEATSALSSAVECSDEMTGSFRRSIRSSIVVTILFPKGLAPDIPE